MRLLRLPIKRFWFDMIFNRIKLEEYRDYKDYYHRKLKGKSFDAILFVNGYNPNSDCFIIKLNKIDIAEGKVAWGAVPGKTYYSIHVGDILTPIFKLKDLSVNLPVVSR